MDVSSMDESLATGSMYSDLSITNSPSTVAEHDAMMMMMAMASEEHHNHPQEHESLGSSNCGSSLSSKRSRRSRQEQEEDFLDDDHQQQRQAPNTRHYQAHDNNCYRDVLNGQLKDDFGRIRSSWLHDLTWCFSSSSERLSTSFSSSEIKALSQQLKQVKRRLGKVQDAGLLLMEERAPPYSPFHQARRACNPFEVLSETNHCGLNPFINRSAIKLANINALLGFHLTSTTTSSFEHHGSSSSDGPLFFVDLCGAPGGFAEYLLSRSPCHNKQPSHHSPNHPYYDDHETMQPQEEQDNTNACASSSATSPSLVRGIGMSLIGSNEHGRGLEWKIGATTADGNSINMGDEFQGHDVDSNSRSSGQVDDDGSGNNFSICFGADGTGDVYLWENVLALRERVLTELSSSSSHGEGSTLYVGGCGPGVPLVVADGGMDVQRNSEVQEQLTQKLIICQVAAALLVLQYNGTLVLKMFGFQTDLIRNVMTNLLSTDWFQNAIVIKPITSRPASAERYVILTGFQRSTPPSPEEVWKWRNAMFLGRPPKRSTTLTLQEQEEERRRHNHVLSYLDRMDRNMFELNLQACFALLTNLQQQNRHDMFNVEDSGGDDDEMDQYYPSMMSNMVHASRSRNIEHPEGDATYSSSGSSSISSRGNQDYPRVHCAAYQREWKL